MPLPIHVVLIASTVDQVTIAQKHFRLSVPGIGTAYLAAIDAEPGNKIAPPAELPKALITLWLCLDQESFIVTNDLHNQDVTNHRYGRCFYANDFPEPCVLIEGWQESPQVLTGWAEKIIAAWYATS